MKKYWQPTRSLAQCGSLSMPEATETYTAIRESAIARKKSSASFAACSRDIRQRALYFMDFENEKDSDDQKPFSGVYGREVEAWMERQKPAPPPVIAVIPFSMPMLPKSSAGMPVKPQEISSAHSTQESVAPRTPGDSLFRRRWQKLWKSGLPLRRK
jgi:hypothetical protein